MHASRLSFLADKHRQWRAVVARDVRTDGTVLTLECGHAAVIVPHFDTTHTKNVGCCQCGERYVRAAPQYVSEFYTDESRSEIEREEFNDQKRVTK